VLFRSSFDAVVVDGGSGMNISVTDEKSSAESEGSDDGSRGCKHLSWCY
jgi:hypothetical protein